MKLRDLALSALVFVAFVSTAAHAEDATPAAPATAAATEPPPTAEQVAAGKQLYQNKCARCHGWNMVNLGSISFDLRKFPKDDKARFFNSVTNGKRAMPSWKDTLTPDDIQTVWNYVRSGGATP